MRVHAYQRRGFQFMLSTFQRAYPSAVPPPGLVYWLPFRGPKLLVQHSEQGTTLIAAPVESMTGMQPQNTLYVGTIDGIACIACEVDENVALPPGWRELDLRSLFGRLDETEYGVVGY